MKIQLSFLGTQIIKKLDTMEQQTALELIPNRVPPLGKVIQAIETELNGLIKLGIVEECEPEVLWRTAAQGSVTYRLKRATREEWWLLCSAIEIPYGIMLPVVKAGAEEEVEWTLNT